MQSFLSSPQIPNNHNVLLDLIAPTQVSSRNQLPLPKHIFIPHDANTLIAQVAKTANPVKLTSDTPLFSHLKAQHPLFFVVDITSSAADKNSPFLLTELVTKRFQLPLTNPSQQAKLLNQMKVLPSTSSTLINKAQVLTSTPSQITFQLDIPELKANTTETKAPITNKPLAVIVDNPPKRPQSGKTVHLAVSVKDADNLTVSWSEKRDSKQTLLSQVNQRSQVASSLKALLLQQPQWIKLQNHSVSKQIPITISQPKNVVFTAEIRNAAISLQAELPEPKAQIVQNKLDSLPRLPPDWTLSSISPEQIKSVKQLPRLTLEPITPEMETQWKEQSITKLQTLLTNHKGPIDKEMAQALREPLRVMLRQSLAKANPDISLQGLQKDVEQIPDLGGQDLKQVSTNATKQPKANINVAKLMQQFLTPLPQTTEANVERQTQSSILNLAQSALSEDIKNTVIASLFPLSQSSVSAAVQQAAPNNLITALVKVLANIRSAKNTTSTANRVVQNNPAQQSEQPFLKQAFDAFINHQVNKLVSADAALSGQEQLYYALPITDVLKTPTEILVKPIAEENNEKKKAKSTTRAWQLTMKLSIGELGELLAKSQINQTALQLDVYTDSQKLLAKVRQSMPALKQRLQSIAELDINISAQQGLVPETLKPQSLHLLEVQA